MKKFTLLLFSLFLTLGTAMAQDDAFQLIHSNPANNAKVVPNVYYIQLMFNKDVTTALPEEPIIVKSTTGIEYKVYNIFPSGPNAIFYMQRTDNAEATYITEPGTYTYTIPAGVVSSVDGDSFGEYTASFTVFEKLEVVDITPSQTTKLETIQITFSKPIAEVKMADYDLSVTNDYSESVTSIKNEVSLSDDKMTVTMELENPITTIGWYCINFPEGLFISEDGAMNTEDGKWIEVIDPAPSFSANYENNEEVKEIGDLELTFKNVNEVKLVEGADDAVIYMPGGGDATGSATLADNKITIKFNQEFTEEGIYTFFIPANFFTMDGVPNEVYELSVTLKTFALTPLEVLSVSPDAGSVENINRIIIAFNQPVSLAWDENDQQISREIKLTCGDKEYTLTNDAGNSASASNTLEYIANAEWDGYKYTSTPITAEGTYTLNLADIVVNYGAESYIDEYGWQNTRWNGTGSCEGTYTWTIASTGIEEVKGENGKAKGIYDLQGRKVENPSKGMYIIDGKKVLVK